MPQMGLATKSPSGSAEKEILTAWGGSVCAVLGFPAVSRMPKVSGTGKPQDVQRE